MKQLISALLLFITVTSGAASIDYIIEGEVEGQEGKTFQVSDYDKDEIIGTGIVKNGKLRITGSYDNNAFVRVENGNTFANCVIDTLAILDFNTRIPAGGSNLNVKLRDLLLEDSAFSEEFDRFMSELNSHGFNNEEAWEIYLHLYNKRRPEILDLYTRAIKENDNGIGTAFIMNLSKLNDLSCDEWDKIYLAMPDNLKKSKLATSRNEKFNAKRLSEPGKPFIDFEIKGMDGHQKRLSDYVGQGKYVLVDFWASWCGPCKEEAKNVLMPLYERYKDNDNFMILGVSTWDEENNVRQSLESTPYPWQQVMSNDDEPMKLYGFDYIPMIILFSPEGTIICKDLRGTNLIECVENNIGMF